MDTGGLMRAEWNEAFFDAQREEPLTYWVCFWIGADDELAVTHDPQRITDADSVEEVLAWIHDTKGDRDFELFVETLNHTETREHGWMPARNLIHLAGNYRPPGTTSTLSASSEN
ncbi:MULTISPECIES: hypothetical protein [unclassified Rathayibacter]|jgi:hypothetical protein|uniref:hypothetical protein n=1 Tax=unclassified Rathayibacter TaxID=2609250 RepID=UPI000CE86CE3|nr:MULTISPECIES: hypothetical protein [unclassified Rathayibacter]PPF25707.1 hypothetical protein C5C54_14480 [Rathayibacter sp. AY1F2]PPG94375.1 hypothetical protein C5C32_17020 [Rathayibacter sp. AY1G9]PPH16175.1 hypothetical protein C5C35_11320 [Rathayibacter sp. AY1F8]PPH31297.1 hypothetical protein C5C37_02025 [Rathayibacter sp. AY1F9]PPH43651.1 hypothetical protein C5C42_13205 [Rathayibacter sp. AY1F7]